MLKKFGLYFLKNNFIAALSTTNIPGETFFKLLV